MDINVARSLITVLSFLTFLGIVYWAYSGSRSRFDEAAKLPFSDEAIHEDTLTRQRNGTARHNEAK